MAMLELLKGMAPGVTTHGFRSTFSAIGRTTAPAYAPAEIELALAHVVGNKVAAAYRRGDALDKRRRLMAEWARYCETAGDVGAADNVRSLRA